MTKFDVINFVANASVDLNGEFDDLDKLIEGGRDKVNEIRHAYNHLRSLIQGMEYTLEFINDDEDRQELMEFIKRQKDNLEGYLPRCLSISYSDRMNCKVEVTTYYKADGGKEYIVNDPGCDVTLNTIDEVVKHLRERAGI